METAARQLFQTVKDHNNDSIQDMVDISNIYCYRNVEDSSSDIDSDDEEDEEFYPVHFPTALCCFVLVNHRGYVETMEKAIRQLRSDGLVVHTQLLDLSDKTPSAAPCNEVTATIRKIERVMQLCQHGLYCGNIYAKPDDAQLTYVKLMDVTAYLNKLLANNAISEHLIRHFHTIDNILSHPACEIIEQIRFDCNLIEVSDGVCFSITDRDFVTNVITQSQIGKLSPRAYVPYDSSTEPRPGYFREDVYNSFPERQIRVNFLNKFYQCLVASRMPPNTRKLVVAGPRDSGKTSWACVFQRIIPPEYIASITSERQFSASMIIEATQLVIIDEWSAHTMNADLVKTLLQGGWMVTAVKHGLPRSVNSYSPFYVTTNKVPDFKDENDNVQRRIQVFNTTSLPTTLPGVDRWMYDNAMHCIAWIAEQLNKHRDLLNVEELWYERERNNADAVLPCQSFNPQWRRAEIMQITHADLEPVDHLSSRESDDMIHPRFAAELRSRRLARKRQRRRRIPSTEGSSEEDVPASSKFSPHDQTQQSTNESPPSTPDEQFHKSSGENEPFFEDNKQQQHHDGDYDDDDDDDDEGNDQENADVQSPKARPVAEERAKSSGENETTLDQACTSTGITHDVQQPNVSEDTPERWTLNDKADMTKVADLIKSKFNKDLQKGHVHTFTERVRQAKSMRDAKARQFWQIADPEIEAWMLATGRCREVFRVQELVHQYPDILEHLAGLRKVLNVLVLRSRCPVARALAAKRDGGDEEDNRPEVPSQTYWTTVKPSFR